MRYLNAYDLSEATARLRLTQFTTEIRKDDVRDYDYAASLVRRSQITEAWITLIASRGTVIRPFEKRGQPRDAVMLTKQQKARTFVAAVTSTSHDIAVSMKLVQKRWLSWQDEVVEGATLYPDSDAQNRIHTKDGDIIPYKTSKYAQEQLLRGGRRAPVATTNGRIERAEQACQELILREPRDAKQYIGTLQTLSGYLLQACPAEVVTDWDSRCLDLPHQEFTRNSIDV